MSERGDGKRGTKRRVDRGGREVGYIRCFVLFRVDDDLFALVHGRREAFPEGRVTDAGHGLSKKL
jgi:hypothetical protein